MKNSLCCVVLSVFSVFCCVLSVLSVVQCSLCPLCFAVFSVFSVFCCVLSVLCIVQCSQCSLCCVVFSMFSVLSCVLSVFFVHCEHVFTQPRIPGLALCAQIFAGQAALIDQYNVHRLGWVFNCIHLNYQYHGPQSWVGC